MARMMPSIDPESIKNDAERILYKALRDRTPGDWTVRYHYVYCVRTSSGLRDGEADFVVIAPGLGLMFLEVKASHGYECRDGRWYRVLKDGAEVEVDNPFDQACRCKHDVVERIVCPALKVPKWEFPGTYGHAVVYPKAKVKGQLPASQDPLVIMTYHDVEQIEESIRTAFQAWGADYRGQQFSGATVPSVVSVLSDKSSFVAVAAADVDEDLEKIDHLTVRQFETYRGLLANNRALVLGPAGSGKTMLAMWTAQLFADEGRTLFLCYNKALASWLRARYAEKSGLHVTHFHGLCASYAGTAGLAWPTAGPADPKFWSETAPTLLDEALAALGDRGHFDTIIVDEAQDFHPNWWIPVELLLRGNRATDRLYVFLDPDQAIQYGGEQAYPVCATQFRLDTNCRNTQQVAQYCGRVVGKSIPSLKGAPVGDPPVILPPLATVSERVTRCRQLVHRWLKEGFRPSRIAVLSPWSASNQGSSLHGLIDESVGGFGFARDAADIDRWFQGEVVWCSTIKSFKGLEADCLIVTDIPAQESVGFSANDLYVAVSRARRNAVLLPTSDAARAMVSQFALPEYADSRAGLPGDAVRP